MDTKQMRKMILAKINLAQLEIEFLYSMLKDIDGEAKELPQQIAPEAAPEVKEEPKKAPSKKAAAKPEVKEEPKTESVDDMFGDEADEALNEPTLDDVRKTVKDFATKHGKEKALKLLGKFKVTSIPDLKKSDFAAVIALAKKHL